MSSKGGRPMLMDAVRYACGQINKRETRRLQEAEAKKRSADERGEVSPKVKMERDFWNLSCFKGGKQGAQSHDAIGQLWLLGQMDFPDMDETQMLAAARTWWKGRETVFKHLGHKTARYERASRSSSESTALSRIEREYYRYESFLRDASDFECDCLAGLMGPPDSEFDHWASRIIRTQMLKVVRLPLVMLATEEDYYHLEAARRALLAMSGAEARRRAA